MSIPTFKKSKIHFLQVYLIFGTCNHSQNKLCGAYITHINNNSVFSTNQTLDKLKLLYKQFLKDKDLSSNLTTI